MSASFGAATSKSRPELINATYRRLRRLGFEDGAAANLAAVMNGVPLAPQPWTVRELTHLLFLRELRRAGRRWSDPQDRADHCGRPLASAMTEPGALATRVRTSPAGTSNRGDADPSDGRVTLLTLFRSMAGPNASLDFLRPSASPQSRLGAPGDGGREGG